MDARACQRGGPDGNRIATEDVGVIDTHYLLSIPEREPIDDEPLTPEQQAEVDEFIAAWKEAHEGDIDLAPDEEVEFPRYQLQVQLVDDRDVP